MDDRKGVKLMTTVHDISNIDKSFTFCDRRRPKLTSTNSSAVREPFGTYTRRYFPIPTSIDDYNQNMSGVDSFDQRRAVFIA